MDTSPQGIEFIRRHEGVRLKAYCDSAGVWTIGVGHTAAAGPPKPRSGMVLTMDQVIEILEHDLARYEDRVDRIMGIVPQCVFD